MTMLRFRHQGWDMLTASWTAGSPDGRQTVVCYSWSGYDSGIKVKFDIPFEAFLDRVAGGGIVDLGAAL